MTSWNLTQLKNNLKKKYPGDNLRKKNQWNIITVENPDILNKTVGNPTKIISILDIYILYSVSKIFLIKS